MEALLEVTRLEVKIERDKTLFPILNGVSFTINRGEIVGLVGESGSGKSVLGLSILRLLSKPLSVTGGEVVFNHRDLLRMDDSLIREVRGHQISMIFQEPMTTLNPVFTCGEQIEEVLVIHQPHLSKEMRRAKVIEALSRVGISEPEKRYAAYPHQLSGGMRQRVVIAMALICQPELIIADEPTTALDMTIQAQILDVLRKNHGEQSSVILITHDLGVVAEMCDRVFVMYAGRIVESGEVEDIFFRTRHPYTRGLLNSIPKPSEIQSKKPLASIPGVVPSIFSESRGCQFYDRCFARQENCRHFVPELKGEDHQYACHYPLNEGSFDE